MDYFIGYSTVIFKDQKMKKGVNVVKMANEVIQVIENIKFIAFDKVAKFSKNRIQFSEIESAENILSKH